MAEALRATIQKDKEEKLKGSKVRAQPKRAFSDRIGIPAYTGIAIGKTQEARAAEFYESAFGPDSDMIDQPHCHGVRPSCAASGAWTRAAKFGQRGVHIDSAGKNHRTIILEGCESHHTS